MNGYYDGKFQSFDVKEYFPSSLGNTWNEYKKKLFFGKINIFDLYDLILIMKSKYMELTGSTRKRTRRCYS